MWDRLVILLITMVYWIPLIAGIWAIVTLRRLRDGQTAMRRQLEEIERKLQDSGRH